MTKLGMRRTWFQVHKWIGLILAIVIIPISLTGSALVWHDGLERWLSPARFAVSGDAVVDAKRYVRAAQAQLGKGERISQLTLPDEDGAPVTVAASQPGKAARQGPPPRTTVYLDPPSARVLEVTKNSDGLIRTMHVLHGSLMLPGVGRQIVGWIGVAMMLSAFTGLWLWWPTVGKWARGLRWRRHPNTDTNLHHMMGFWIALPLFVLSLSGAWISFPAFFRAFETTPAPKAAPGPDRAAMARAKPLETTRLDLDTAIASAQAIKPGDVRQVTWPTDLKPVWAVQVAGEGRPTTIEVADADGAAKAAPAAPPRSGPTARLMRQIHDGTDMGIVWQVLIFIGGILPAILAVTGIIMWWRARGWKAELKARQAARRGPVAAE